MIRKTVAADRVGASRSGARRAHELTACYTTLASRLMARRNGSPVAGQAIGVTSCLRSEGVTTVAANLAVALASVGAQQTLVLDGNMDDPAVATVFQVSGSPGLAELLRGVDDADRCIQPSSIGRLSVLAAGAADDEAAVFNPQAAKELLCRLRRQFDFIVADLPPVNEPSTCLALAGMFDGVLLVVEAERVGCEAALRAKQQLALAKAPLWGAVFNKRKQRSW
jgi:capsular exopolysaccharide synthesis family protein